jgi:hypothetical protein
VKNLTRRFVFLPALIFVIAGLTACSKPPVDPVEQTRILIPKVADGLNRRDIGALKDLGTKTFEPNGFIADVFAHGVSGDVTLTLKRFRQVPGENRLMLSASFGPNQSGGLKELTLMLTGEKILKIDTYTLVDINIPPAGPGGGAPGTQGR